MNKKNTRLSEFIVKTPNFKEQTIKTIKNLKCKKKKNYK